MKKYETPEYEIEKFTIVSVFTASSLDMVITVTITVTVLTSN